MVVASVQLVFLPLANRKPCSLTACGKEAQATRPLPLNALILERAQLHLMALAVLEILISCC